MTKKKERRSKKDKTAVEESKYKDEERTLNTRRMKNETDMTKKQNKK
jgi:hypothetical protein